MQDKPYIVIMAGGIGARFWPYSRRRRPKQFLDMLGTGRSLLQMTFDRFREMADIGQFRIVTYRKYAELVKEQLPELDVSQIFIEPSRKNTATCIAFAAYKIRSIDPDANLVFTPADHLILQEKKFNETILKAVKAAKLEGRLITIGIKPNRPETGYGYIQYRESVSEETLKVKTFTEKPNLKLATTFIESGEFVWNSGLFVVKVSSVIQAFQKYMPDLAEAFEDGLSYLGTPKESEYISRTYMQVKNISIDYGILEKSDAVYMILGDFGWSDLGSWNSLHEINNKDALNNVVDANAILYQTTNSFIKVNKEKLVVIQGLDNYLINDSENVLLICKLDSEKKFREFVSHARSKGEDFI